MSRRASGIGFLTPVDEPARDPEQHYFISATLHLPGNAITYDVSERLAALFPDRAVIQTNASAFELEDYAAEGHCVLAARPEPHAQRVLEWYGPEDGLKERVHNAWLDVSWQGHDLEVVVVSCDDQRHWFILAEAEPLARRFVDAVCAWGMEVRDEVLVFEHGRWAKSERLFHAIKGACFDNLVLRDGLRDEILGDATRFFAARATYESFGVPWKRGILFAGPPGNGKTHTVKALANALDTPCLYVKSFREREDPDEYSMQRVFERARALAPCILVLEDLDALVTDANRSFFLNEMDGFAANGGILTVATSNHPERLDAAIVQRPSRFDRTYRFDLPGQRERAAYVAHWTASTRPEMRLSPDAVACVAARTENFSFAYLKELFLSATMRWMEAPGSQDMAAVLDAQVAVLRQQMLGTEARDRDL